MTIHELKVHTQFWQGLIDGTKPFELRRNDRDFKVGDAVRLKKFDPSFGFLGDDITHFVTYILLPEDCPGLMPGYCILGLGLIEI